MKPQAGNILWFILVAIVLIGALTMVLSRSNNTVDQSGDVEQARIKAGQVMRFAKGVEAAVSQMLLRGVSENDISFEQNGTHVNANCGADGCKVFATNGGGIAYTAPSTGVNDGSAWIFTGDNNIGSTNNPVGTTATRSGNDLIMLLPNTKIALCTQINRDLDIGTPGTLPSEGTEAGTTPFNGTYNASLKVLEGNGNELDGKTAGCFTDTAADPDVTYFYAVVLAR